VSTHFLPQLTSTEPGSSPEEGVRFQPSIQGQFSPVADRDPVRVMQDLESRPHFLNSAPSTGITNRSDAGQAARYQPMRDLV
jgi:hypothetical protein